ncbi:MAG: hypothetical protein QM692_21640 [Thermomicrobiales bacterium]
MTEPPAWLLLLLGSAPDRRPMDVARIVLGMFLIDQQVLEPTGQFYCFDAFESGPLSIEVHRDLQWLRVGQLVEKWPPSSADNATSYTLTDAGRDAWTTIALRKTPEQLTAIQDIAAYVTSHRLEEIRDHIWREYPEYAVPAEPLAPTGD